MGLIDLLSAFENTPPPSDLVLPGLVASSVGVIFSPGGVGKSFFLMEACMAVACAVEGGDLLNLQPQKNGRVVYVAAEDPAPEIVRRVHHMGKHFTPLAQRAIAEALQIQSAMGKRLNVVDDRKLDELVERAKGSRLIVFDTLSRIHTLDENSAGDMGVLMGALEYLATETGAAVVFAHHVSKGASRDGQQDQQHAARGSSLLVDNGRWAASLSRMTIEESRLYRDMRKECSLIDDLSRRRYIRLSLPKANYSETEPDLWLERVDGGVLIPAKLERESKSCSRVSASPKASRAARTTGRWQETSHDWE